jgi:hypothetical protein
MDNLDRLYRRLADTLRREHSGSLDRPVTVAEIYQHLVPYRAVRSELGFSELAEYEHTLLRLLAGEKDYAQVDIPQARDDFRRELRAPNPLLGLYRDYAAVGVRVNIDDFAPVAAEVDTVETYHSELPDDELPLYMPRPEADPGTAVNSTIASPARSPAAEPAAALDDAPAPPPVFTPAPEVVSRTAPDASTCRSCDHRLPDIGGWEIRFCPFCGENQLPLPCRECGTPVEPEWRFCIQCGIPRRPDTVPTA